MTSLAASHSSWTIGPGRTLELNEARVLAIINATPDSFSDGGENLRVSDALASAHRAIEEGAWGLDIGGESTRPGASAVKEAEQIRRVVPIIEAVRGSGIDAPISVDTTLSPVARAALDAGADLINDVSGGLDDKAMLTLAGERGCGIILMHRLRPPDRDSFSDQYDAEPAYDPDHGGVVGVVRGFLKDRLNAARDAGVDERCVVLDPGLGFGKSVEQNFELVRGTGSLLEIGRPLLSAGSRKSFIGAATGGASPAERVAGSVALGVAHYLQGVRLFRAHDVRAHVEALRVAHRIGGTG